MSERQLRMIGGVRIGPYQKLWYRSDVLDPWVPITLNPTGPSVFYPTTNEEAFDLKFLLQELFINEMLDVSITMLSNTTGQTTFDRGTQTYFELTSRADGATDKADNSDNVWAILFPQLAAAGVYNIVLTGGDQSYTTDGPHGFGVYPRRYLAKFLNDQKMRQAQELSWGGRSSGIHISKLKEHRLELRLVGSMPRELVQNEYHQIQDFMTLAACGMPVLVYPDRTVFSPYARLTNPYGWFRGVLKRETGDFEPTRADGDMYDNWNIELTFHDIGEP